MATAERVETARLVRQLGAVTAADIALALDISKTAAGMRLRRLWFDGRLSRRRLSAHLCFGRAAQPPFVYKLTPRGERLADLEPQPRQGVTLPRLRRRSLTEANRETLAAFDKQTTTAGAVRDACGLSSRQAGLGRLVSLEALGLARRAGTRRTPHARRPEQVWRLTDSGRVAKESVRKPA